MEEVKINVSALTSQLVEMVTSSENLKNSPGCCIFRIPNILSQHNPRAYEPNAFSIGPFHHGKPHLQQSQTIKANYLKALLSHTDPEPTDLRALVNAGSQIHDEARNCYAGPIGMSSDDFVQLLVLDGCFIIELFLRNAFRHCRETPHGPIFGSLCQVEFLYHDLFLLENQIPWMVLKLLFDMTTKSINNTSLFKLAFLFFRNQSCFPEGTNEINLPSEAKHILDLLWCFMVKSFDPTPSRYNLPWEKNMLSATALEESGIKIQSIAAASSESILCVTFRDGVLEIPHLLVNEATDALFRNLVALELYCPNYDGVITSYVKLLDELVQTKADMKLLCDNEVVKNTLSLDKATQIFNQASEEYSRMKVKHYNNLIDDMGKYRRRRRGYFILRWRVYMRDLKRVYFSHPWAAMSTVAASFILIFTFLQTLFTILSYKKC